jgi:uncharacterized protein
MLSRRRFLSTGTRALAGAAVAGVYSIRLEPFWLDVTLHRMPLHGLPPALHGATLVQLSDIHVGGWMDDRYVARVLERARRMEPDLVVYTGDQVTQRLGGDPLGRLERVMRHVARGRLGTFGVLGNHDGGRGYVNTPFEPARAAMVAGILEAAGVTMLRNASVEVEGLAIAGTEDLWSGHFDLPQALTGVRAGQPLVTLTHNPDAADKDGWGDRRGWILAGHTHGGQVRIPFLPPPVLNVSNRRYASGTIHLKGGRTLHVSRGVGFVTPLRFGARPELAVFQLERA